MTPWTPPVDLTQLAVPPRVYPTTRSPAALLDVVAQLDPAKSPRYQRRDVDGNGTLETFCNFFVRDALNALGVKMPKLRANEMVAYFARGEDGWRELDVWASVREARQRAQQGFPVIAGWANPNPQQSGHVALVVPSPEGSGLRIAQAGVTNFSNGTLQSGFGGKPVVFWTHD